MKGLGFFIWQLASMPRVDLLIDVLRQTGVEWVSIKVSDNDQAYNQIGGNDKVLRDEYIVAMQEAGIEVGGWSYVYPDRPGPNGARISERVEKLGLSHIMLDVETEWKQPNLGKRIDMLLDGIDVNLKYPVGFCSYRYPSMHGPLNFKRFLENPMIKFNAPQVYWLGSHDPAKQMQWSWDDYAGLPAQPFMPIGSTFGWGEWTPSEIELKVFIAKAKELNCPAWGFYSLDYIFKKQRYDWLSAIAGKPVTPPVPPPAPLPHTVTVKANGTNVRNAATLTSSSDVGDLTAGAKLGVIGQDGEFWKVELWVHKSVVR